MKPDCYSAKMVIQCALAIVADERLEDMSEAAEEAAVKRTLDRLALALQATWSKRALAAFKTRES